MRFYPLLLAAALCGLLAASARADPIAIEAFAADPSLWSPAVSPDGKWLAYFRSVDGDDALVVAQVMDDRIVSYAPTPSGEHIDFNWVVWKSSDRLLLSVTSHQPIRGLGATRFPFRRLISANRDGSDMKILMDVRRVKWFRFRFDDVVSLLPEDPDHVLLGFSTEGDHQSDVYKVNIRTGERELVLEHPKGQFIRDWYADWDGVVRYGYGWDKRRKRVMTIRGADGQWFPLNRIELFEDGRFRPLGFSFDDRYIYVVSSHVTGRDALFQFDLEKGELAGKVFESDRYDVDGLIVSRARRRAVAVSYTSDRPQRHYLDEEYRLFWEGIDAALPDKANTIVSTTRDEKFHIVFSANERDPGQYYLYDASKNPRVLTPFGQARPELDPERMAPVKPVVYEARDTLPIPAYLTLPNDGVKGPRAAVVMPHGGPWVRDSLAFDLWAQFLASRGYAVIQPNFRGSSGYGDRFEALGYGGWGRSMQDDVTDAANWLVAQGIADPARICVVGGSYGGYAAIMGVIKAPDVFACAVSFAGVSDIRRMLKEDGDYATNDFDYRRVAGDLSKEELERISPIKRVAEIGKPVLLVHGDADEVVSVRHSRDLADALKEQEKPVRYVELADETHYMESRSSRVTWFRELEAFLQQHIGGPAQTAPTVP